MFEILWECELLAKLAMQWLGRSLALARHNLVRKTRETHVYSGERSFQKTAFPSSSLAINEKCRILPQLDSWLETGQGHMHSLGIPDIEKMVRIVAETCGNGSPWNESARKRNFVEEVSIWLRADAFVLTLSPIDFCQDNNASTRRMLDGGRRGVNQSTKGFQQTSEGRLQAYQRSMNSVFTPVIEATMLEWHPEAGESWMLFVYPVSTSCFSAIGLQRAPDKPNFTTREQTIARIFFSQIPWLHKPARPPEYPEYTVTNKGLAPRHSQVLELLLAGDSKKSISSQLQISEHTVGGYVKEIYKHFAVNSRSELQAFFWAASQGGSTWHRFDSNQNSSQNRA